MAESHKKEQAIAYEKINMNERMPIRIIDDSPRENPNPRFVTELHWHRSIEILYTNQSTGIVYINGKKQMLDVNTVYIINSQDIHRFDVSGQTAPYTGYAMQINYEFMQDILSKTRLDLDCQFQVNEHNQPYVLTIIKEIINYYYQGPVKNQQIITSLCAALIFVLSQYCVSENNQQFDSKKLQSKKIIEIISDIDHRYDQDIDINELARKHHLSYSYMAMLFKDMLGISIKQYINNKRLNKATSLLKTTDKQITDIAYESGYPNTTSFISQFKKMYQVTPYQYRKTLTLSKTYETT